ncbi:MAG: type II toxin-antitoxin system RelE/ParE family toxin [Rhodanobacteraceae bacterium]
MVFIETDFFKEDIDKFLTQEEFGEFQEFLANNPKAGPVIPGTGGVRKVRWAVGNKGKSGGLRVIYYYVMAASQIRFLLVYRKGIKDTLSDREKSVLKKLIEAWSDG